MKKKSIQFIAVILLLIVSIVSCKKEPVSGVTLDNDLLLFVGETATLTVSIMPSNAHNQNVSWESSDLSVATVNNGKVTGIIQGKAIITVITENGGKTAKCYVTVTQPIEPEMIWVEEGTFAMGCSDDECLERELPLHDVQLSSFSISKYPITQKVWTATMSKNPSSRKGDNLPVETVTYDDIQSFIERLNSYTGKKYRLPTEAEWEYAARGGNKSKGYKYSGSDNVDEVAWISGMTHTVGTKAPNELGIYDMSGNVFELCNDWYGIYTNASQINPQGPSTSSYGRAIRGGNYGNVAFYCRVAFRMPDANQKASNSGFRIVLSEK